MTEIIIAAVGIIGALLFGIRQGRRREQADRAKTQAKADAKTHNKAKEARDEVSGMSDADILDRLRDRAER